MGWRSPLLLAWQPQHGNPCLGDAHTSEMLEVQAQQI